LLLASLACGPASAAEDWMKGSFSLGISYPLVVSASLGAVLPFDPRDRKYPIATTPGVRIDGEIGLGGGSVGAGLYIPVKEYFVVNVKAARMRTWLWTWNEETNRTFDGVVVEFAVPSLHGGPKLGLGSFKDTRVVGDSRRSFTYVFLGAGF
jgi:hypothetical protein